MLGRVTAGMVNRNERPFTFGILAEGTVGDPGVFVASRLVEVKLLERELPPRLYWWLRDAMESQTIRGIRYQQHAPGVAALTMHFGTSGSVMFQTALTRAVRNLAGRAGLDNSVTASASDGQVKAVVVAAMSVLVS